MSFLSVLVLIFTPLLAALLILSPLFPNNEIKIRRFAKFFGVCHFIYSMLFLLFFNQTNIGWSYQKELAFFNTGWLKTLGLTATFGMDGISLSFVILTTFLVMLVLIASKSMIRTKHRIFYPLVLILETAFLGLLCAKDIFLFLVCWQLEIIPFYFLISQWGDKTSVDSANKYVSYMALGSMFLFLGMLVLYFYSFSISGILNADMESLNISGGGFAFWFQSFVFFCLLIGFAVKLPIFPFHNMLPSAQTEAVEPVSILLGGLLPVAGGYGIIRFNIGLFPEVFAYYAPLLILLGVVNILSGAILALVQTDIKKIVSYGGIFQTGFVLIGLGSLTQIGFEGAVFQLIVLALISAGLFMVTGIIRLRVNTREITALGGLGRIMPICMSLGLIIALGAVSVPFTAGFAPKFMILTGLALSDIEPQSFLAVNLVLSLLGLFIGVVYVVNLFHKIFFGPILSRFKSDTVQYDEDGNEVTVIYPKRGITKSEIIVLSFLCLTLIFLGLFPNVVLDIFQVTSDIILDFMKV